MALDLDETLIHTEFNRPRLRQRAKVIMNMKPEGIGYVLYRPGVIDFLKSVTQLYEVAIFTASVKEYADPIIDGLEAACGSSFYRLYR